MKTIYFRQCQLSRKTETGVIKTTTYLPQKYAEVGAELRLRDEDNNWTYGWVVDAAHEPLIAEDLLPDSHKARKEHRKNTGDSLPKERK
jgi:hypothetical protein